MFWMFMDYWFFVDNNCNWFEMDICNCFDYGWLFGFEGLVCNLFKVNFCYKF